jgi:serine/threonine protein kinase
MATSAPIREGFGQPWDELSGYKAFEDSDGAEFWYRCVRRNCPVYLSFASHPKIGDIRHALTWAADNDVLGVEVTHNPESGSELLWSQPHRLPWQLLHELPYLRAIPFRPIEERAFNASDYRTIDFEALTVVRPIARCVTLVQYNGQQYAYKYITREDRQWTFETEFKVYLKIRGCAGVPELIAVITHHGRIRGFLLTFIDGENLAEKHVPRNLLPDAIRQVIDIAADLEQRGFYHSDLKGTNIVRREKDGEIFIIDFGGPGVTEDWCKESLLSKYWKEPIQAPDAIYILGKTIWELWTDKVPKGDLPEDIPTEIRGIIEGCCISEKYNTIAEIKQEYCSKMSCN